MIINLNEINRVLLSINELGGASVTKKLLLQHLEGEVLLGRNPEFGPVIQTLAKMGIVSDFRGKVQVTPFGTELIEHNREQLYELRPEQRRLLIRKCYLNGALRQTMKRVVRKFSIDPKTGQILWSPVDSEPIEDLEWLIEHLLQLGVLEGTAALLRVRKSYRPAILQFIDESPDFTEEQFENQLRDKRLSGEIAEAFAMFFEIERLRSGGHSVESMCVNRISKFRVNAGYDIESFDGKSIGSTHDRFIEVKGSGQVTVRFIWSPNEMRIAERLRDRYWIYFVGGVDRKNSTVTREPVLINDPHATLASDPRFSRNQQNELVEANLAGSVLSRPVPVTI